MGLHGICVGGMGGGFLPVRFQENGSQLVFLDIPFLITLESIDIALNCV